MAIDLLNAIAVTESDEKYSINNYFKENPGNGEATDDHGYFGDVLTENANKGSIEFSKKYLNLTFELTRDSIYDFTTIKSGSVTLQGTVIKTFDYNPLGNGMYTSQTDDVFNSNSCRNVIIRVQIPTREIYNIGCITSITCTVYTSSNLTRTKTFNLNDPYTNPTIYKGCKWYTELGMGTWLDKLDKGDNYTYKKITPKLSLGVGSVNVYSETLSGKESCKELYFTETNGRIYIDFSNITFFSPGQYRIPSTIILEGEDKIGMKKNEPITILERQDDGTYNDLNSDYYFFRHTEFSEKLAVFSKINKVYAYFGGDDENIFLVKDYPNGFLNSDIPDNVLLNFEKTKGHNNKINELKEYGSIYNMDAELQGTIEVSSTFPFENFKPIQLIKENKNSLKIDLVNSFSVSGSKIEIDYKNTYEARDTGNSLDLSSCPLESGAYALKCEISNKLKTRESPGTEQSYTFKFSEDKGISVSSIENEYVVFGGPVPKIKYLTEEVDGVIIVPGERLNFPAISEYPFRVYNTETGQLLDISSGERKVKIWQYNIGLHPIYHSTNSVTPENLSQEYTIEYDTLKRWLSDEGGDEQKKLYITFLLTFTDANTDTSAQEASLTNISMDKIHIQPFIFVLGRLEAPQLDSMKIQDQKIKYSLLDNGCDRILAKTGVIGVSQNQFIQNRLGNGKFFSISRNSTETEDDYGIKYELMKERLKISVTSTGQNKITEKAIITIIRLKPGSEAGPPSGQIKLETALNLLNTNQINEFSLDDLNLLGGDREKIDSIIRSGAIDLKIAIEYVYKSDTSSDDGINDEIVNEIWKLELKNINLLPGIVPLGMRKGGVIINPKDNQNLTPSNGRKNSFIINVKDVEKNDDDVYTPVNGLRIEFQTGEQNTTLPFFEIYLDEEGKICFASEDGIFKPTFSKT